MQAAGPASAASEHCLPPAPCAVCAHVPGYVLYPGMYIDYDRWGLRLMLPSEPRKLAQQ